MVNGTIVEGLARIYQGRYGSFLLFLLCRLIATSTLAIPYYLPQTRQPTESATLSIKNTCSRSIPFR